MMHNIFRTLVALAYLASATLAQAGFVINSFQFGGAAASITFLQCSAEDVSNATTYTFASQNVGVASADRWNLISVHSVDSATVYGVNSVTVAGDSATEVIDFDGVTARNMALYMFNNVSGTSEDIVVTHSEAATSSQVCLWQINNITSGTAVASAAAAATGAIDASINVSAFGVAAGGCVTVASPSYTVTGLTERYDPGLGSEQGVYAADYTNAGTADSPLSIVFTASSGGGTCATASFL